MTLNGLSQQVESGNGVSFARGELSPDKSGYRTFDVLGFHFSGNRVNQACGSVSSEKSHNEDD